MCQIQFKFKIDVVLLLPIDRDDMDSIFTEAATNLLNKRHFENKTQQHNQHNGEHTFKESGGISRYQQRESTWDTRKKKWESKETQLLLSGRRRHKGKNTSIQEDE